MPSYDDEVSSYDAFEDQIFEPALNKLTKEYERRLIDHKYCDTFSDMNSLDPNSEFFLDSEMVGRLATRYLPQLLR